jgi:hypothetical protein
MYYSFSAAFLNTLYKWMKTKNPEFWVNYVDTLVPRTIDFIIFNIFFHSSVHFLEHFLIPHYLDC